MSRAEEAALKILPNYPPEAYADVEEYIEVESERSLQRAFYQKGYEQAEKDIKEQMMKGAVEGDVYFQLGSIFRVKSGDFRNSDIHFGDKIKIIIVKED